MLQKITAWGACLFLCVAAFILTKFVIAGVATSDLLLATNLFLRDIQNYSFEAAIFDDGFRTDISADGGACLFSAADTKYYFDGSDFYRYSDGKYFLADPSGEVCRTLSLLSGFSIPETAEKAITAGGLMTEYRTADTVFYLSRTVLKRIETSSENKSVYIIFNNIGETVLEPPEVSAEEIPEEEVPPEENLPEIPPEETPEEQPPDKTEPQEFLDSFLVVISAAADAKISTDYYSVHLRYAGENYLFENLETGFVEIFEGGEKNIYNDDGQLVTNYRAVRFYYNTYIDYLSEGAESGGIEAEYREDGSLSAVTVLSEGFTITVYADANEKPEKIEVFSGGILVFEIIYFSVGI